MFLLSCGFEIHVKEFYFKLSYFTTYSSIDKNTFCTQNNLRLIFQWQYCTVVLGTVDLHICSHSNPFPQRMLDLKGASMNLSL